MRPSIVLASLTFGALAVAASPLAHAQSAAPASSAAPSSSSPPPTVNPEGGGVAQAQQHLLRALQSFRDHQYTDAIHEFELANRAAPSADFWFNIARCHELLSHYDDAIDYYRRYLRDKVDPPDRHQVEVHITELQRLADQARAAARRQVAQAAIRFELQTPTPGASASIGDRAIAHDLLTTPVTVAPGTYPVRVTAAGMQDWRASVRVRQGETVTAFVGLQPSTQYQTRSGGHIASYVLGAAAIVALGVGVFFGVDAATQAPCMGDPVAMMADMLCTRRDLATNADIMYGVSAGLVLSTAIVYFIEAGMSRTERVQRHTASNTH